MKEHRIAIEFGKSPSKYYSEAISRCRRFAAASQQTSYLASGDNYEVRHKLVTTDLTHARQLWQIVKNWQSSQLIIDGRLAREEDFTVLYQEQTRAWTSGCIGIIILLVILYALLSGDWEGAASWLSR